MQLRQIYNVVYVAFQYVVAQHDLVPTLLMTSLGAGLDVFSVRLCVARLVTASYLLRAIGNF
jgi:hypothetical protein